MKRRLITVAILLLAGAVVNVVVAWGCAAWSPFPMRAGLSVASQWPGQVPETWPPPRASVGSSFGTKVTHFTSGNWKGPHVQVFAAGWPLRALSAMDRTVVGRYFRPRPGIPLVTLVKNRGLGVLPLRPIWPGLAINTVFYAVVLCLLVSGPFVLRRFIRIRSGLCPKCTYPMGESNVCTECGRELPKRAGVVAT